MKSRRPRGGHRHHGRSPLAVCAINGLAALVAPAAEELGQVEVLEVVRLVEARHLGATRPEMGSGRRRPRHPRSSRRSCGAEEAGPDRRDARSARPLRIARARRRGVPVPRVKDAARPTEVRAQPLLLLGVGEEEVLLVAVIQLREPGGDADHDLLHAAEAPAAEAGVDADAQRAHPRPAIQADEMAASEPKVSIVIPNRDGATPRNGLTSPGAADGHARRAELPRLRGDRR